MPIQLVLTVIWQTIVIYLFLIVALRVIGRAIMVESTLPQYLIVALLGSAVELALYAGSSRLIAGLVSAATLLAMNRIFTVLVHRSALARRALIGTPIVLVHDGQVVAAQLRRAGLTPRDLMTAIRERGYASLDDVRYAVMEPNGSIGVVPRSGRKRS
ncbi:MAG TPA: YetF domain-containing protein [Gemmatimonadaceae bacterium]